MSFPRYPKYKDSGAEWLGNVPEQWAVLPLKARFAIFGGSTPQSENEEYWGGDIPWATPADLSKRTSWYLSETERCITQDGLASCAATLVPQGSIILSTRAPVGSIGLAEVPMCTNQGCRSLVPSAGTCATYFAYVLSITTGALEARAKGTTFLELSGSALGAFRVPVPPECEQLAIAQFLNEETAKIDGLVAEQQRLIALLQEKRQAVISHAVTKGLNPDAPMKPSGVEWLGDVPTHWDLKRFQRCVDIREGQVDPENTAYADLPLIAPNHVESGTGKLLGMETAAEQGAESGKYLCSVGDIVYCKIRPALRKVVLAPADCLCSADMYPLHAHSGLTNPFLFWLLLSDQFSALAILESQRVAMPKINRESLKEIVLPVPNEPEQVLIVAELTKACNAIDQLVTEADRAISLLQEHRTALISAAVTGKIDVRNYSTDHADAA